ESDEWKHTFTNLPTHDKDGNEITYTVEEVALTGYETDTTENDEEGFTITNTQEVIEIEGTKTWKDDNASDRPEDITIQVLIDGTETVVAKEEIGTEENETYKFENLPKYDKDGEEIKYVINESYVPGYTATAEPNEYDITNTRTEKADISITKKWLDEDETDRPDSITVQLYQNDNEYEDAVTITPDDKGQWIYTFADLELFDADGNAYTYEVREINVDEKYEPQEEVQWDAEENSFVITNVRTDTTEVSGEKTWVDTEANADRPESITVRLYANGTEVGEQEVKPEDNEWTYSFTDLPRFDEEGKEIGYMVTEDAVEGYNAKNIKDSF